MDSTFVKVSKDFNRFAGLNSLYEGMNILDQYYCCRVEEQQMLEKHLGLDSHQWTQLDVVVIHFMKIVKRTNLNTL